MKKLNILLSSLEGSFEATGQLCVQFFIVFQRADRAPTLLQWLTIASSCMSLNLPSIEAYNLSKPPVEGAKNEIIRVLKTFPLFFTTSMFRVLSFALIAVFIRWAFVFFLLAAFLVMQLTCIPRTTRGYGGTSPHSVFTIYNLDTDDFKDIEKLRDVIEKSCGVTEMIRGIIRIELMATKRGRGVS